MHKAFRMSLPRMHINIAIFTGWLWWWNGIDSKQKASIYSHYSIVDRHFNIRKRWAPHLIQAIGGNSDSYIDNLCIWLHSDIKEFQKHCQINTIMIIKYRQMFGRWVFIQCLYCFFVLITASSKINEMHIW